jgi:hypothetical protein
MYKTITHLGKSLKTQHYNPTSLSDEDCEKIRNDYFKKPNISKVITELKGIHRGKLAKKNITRYYVWDIMAKVRIHYNKWTVEEAFDCNDVIRVFHDKVQRNPKLFRISDSLDDNIEKALSLGGKGIASQVPNYPLSSVKEILTKYNINDNYYDYSCGWGVRMLGSLATNVNYYGTDPNYLLTEQLVEMGELYKMANKITTGMNIRTQGSEVFIPEWVNTMGIAFSSPPYFGLEDYGVGDQSVKEGVTYDDWLNGYWRWTVENIHKYLIDEGVFLVNINDYANFELVADTRRIAEENGFVMVDTEILVNITRVSNTDTAAHNDEDIMVFRKKGFENVELPDRTVCNSLFDW